jgi:hypothetical protein
MYACCTAINHYSTVCTVNSDCWLANVVCAQSLQGSLEVLSTLLSIYHMPLLTAQLLLHIDSEGHQHAIAIVTPRNEYNMRTWTA